MAKYKEVVLEFTVNIWDFIDIEKLDDALDDAINRGRVNHYASNNARFEFVKITKTGRAKIRAECEREML